MARRSGYSIGKMKTRDLLEDDEEDLFDAAGRDEGEEIPFPQSRMVQQIDGAMIQPLRRLLELSEVDDARDDSCREYMNCLEYANQSNWVSFRCMPDCPWYRSPKDRQKRALSPFFRRSGWHDVTTSMADKKES
jgi:hypothetical protein